MEFQDELEGFLKIILAHVVVIVCNFILSLKTFKIRTKYNVLVFFYYYVTTFFFYLRMLKCIFMICCIKLISIDFMM